MLTMLDSLVAAHSAFELALVAFALVLLPAMSLFYGMRTAKERSLASKTLIRRYLQTMARGWVVAIAVLISWRIAGRPFDELGLAWPPEGLALASLAFAMLAVLFLAYQATFGFKADAKEIAGWKRQLDALKLAPRNAAELAVFTPVAVTAGVWEELFYRGFLMWFFAPVTGVAGAVAATAVLFGVGHLYQGWKGVLRTTAVGLLFGAGYALTGSLWWLMLLHAAVDIFAGFLAFRVYSIHRAEK